MSSYHPPAGERFRILNRIEFHYTPKHGSWLNMASPIRANVIRTSVSRRSASALRSRKDMQLARLVSITAARTGSLATHKLRARVYHSRAAWNSDRRYNFWATSYTASGSP